MTRDRIEPPKRGFSVEILKRADCRLGDIRRERVGESLDISSEYRGELRIAGSDRRRHSGLSEAVNARFVRHSPSQSRTAVIFIDTKTLGSSTPSLATERVGGSVGKNFAYSSFRPMKSFGLASNT